MDAQQKCPSCARLIPIAAPRGLCPACLVSSMLFESAETEAGSPEEASPSPACALDRIGDYEIVEEIGRGGMGIVFKARDLRLGRMVALKLILTGRLASDAEVKRFRVEAEATAQLEHPNIVPIYELGTHEGQPFFAMKLVEGGTLSERISHAGCPLPPREAVQITIGIARAVDHAHQRGILHRDLKPGNVLIDAADGGPMVVDFGLERRMSDTLRLTATGSAMGSPHYMAPEQASGTSTEATTAADIYSLGAVLYEMLTGRPPYTGATPLEILRKACDEEPDPPSRARGLLPGGMDPGPLDPDIDTICLKCLEKDPSKRYASARGLAEDLVRWTRGEPVLARPPSTLERVMKWGKRHPGISSLLVVLIVGAVGLGWLQRANEVRLKLERDVAVQERQKASISEQRAIAEALRAESNALTARLNLYAADIYTASRFAESGRSGPALVLLRNHEPKPGEADLRGLEWYWLRKQCEGHPAKVIAGHSEGIRTLTFTSDGQRLASGEDSEVYLWEGPNWTRSGRFPIKHSSNSWQAKGARGVDIFKNDPAKALEILTGQTSLESVIKESRPDVAQAGSSLALSADGSTAITSGKESFVKFWNAETGTLRSWRERRGAKALLLPTNLALIHAPGSSVEIVDARTGENRETLGAAATQVCISADAKWICILSKSSQASILDSATFHPKVTFRINQNTGAGAAVASDGSRIAVAANNLRSVDIYSTEETSRPPVTTGALESAVQSMAFSPDGSQIAMAMADSTVRIYDSTMLEGHSREIQRLSGHTEAATCVAWSVSGILASGSEDRSIRIWDLKKTTPGTHSVDALTGLIVSPSGMLAAGKDPRRGVVLLDGSTLNLRSLPALDGATPLAVADDGSWVLTSEKGSEADSVRILRWDATQGRETNSFELQGGSLAIADRTGSRVVVLGRREAVIYDARTGKEESRIRGEKQVVMDSGPRAFESGVLALRSWGGNVTVWKSGQEKPFLNLRLPGGASSEELALSDDGSLLAVGSSDNFIRVFCVESGAQLHVLAGHSGSLRALAIGATTVASAGGDGLLKLWSLPTGRELLTLARQTQVRQLRFLESGRVLVASTGNQGTQVWRY
ncbi:MAG: hypothetical protein FJ405_11330 [Verrucomicrobia bacterium]|nr:hypothetical protein [Verrucomicrobiota bacterium]